MSKKNLAILFFTLSTRTLFCAAQLLPPIPLFIAPTAITFFSLTTIDSGPALLKAFQAACSTFSTDGILYQDPFTGATPVHWALKWTKENTAPTRPDVALMLFEALNAHQKCQLASSFDVYGHTPLMVALNALSHCTIPSSITALKKFIQVIAPFSSSSLEASQHIFSTHPHLHRNHQDLAGIFRPAQPQSHFSATPTMLQQPPDPAVAALTAEVQRLTLLVQEQSLAIAAAATQQPAPLQIAANPSHTATATPSQDPLAALPEAHPKEQTPQNTAAISSASSSEPAVISVTPAAVAQAAVVIAPDSTPTTPPFSFMQESVLSAPTPVATTSEPTLEALAHLPMLFADTVAISAGTESAKPGDPAADVKRYQGARRHRRRKGSMQQAGTTAQSASQFPAATHPKPLPAPTKYPTGEPKKTGTQQAPTPVAFATQGSDTLEALRKRLASEAQARKDAAAAEKIEQQRRQELQASAKKAATIAKQQQRADAAAARKAREDKEAALLASLTRTTAAPTTAQAAPPAAKKKSGKQRKTGPPQPDDDDEEALHSGDGTDFVKHLQTMLPFVGEVMSVEEMTNWDTTLLQLLEHSKPDLAALLSPENKQKLAKILIALITGHSKSARGAVLKAVFTKCLENGWIELDATKTQAARALGLETNTSAPTAGVSRADLRARLRHQRTQGRGVGPRPLSDEQLLQVLAASRRPSETEQWSTASGFPMPHPAHGGAAGGFTRGRSHPLAGAGAEDADWSASNTLVNEGLLMELNMRFTYAPPMPLYENDVRFLRHLTIQNLPLAHHMPDFYGAFVATMVCGHQHLALWLLANIHDVTLLLTDTKGFTHRLVTSMLDAVGAKRNPALADPCVATLRAMSAHPSMTRKNGARISFDDCHTSLGDTPLTVAAYYPHLHPVVAYLLSEDVGCDPTHLNEARSTALDAALTTTEFSIETLQRLICHHRQTSGVIVETFRLVEFKQNKERYTAFLALTLDADTRAKITEAFHAHNIATQAALIEHLVEDCGHMRECAEAFAQKLYSPF